MIDSFQAAADEDDEPAEPLDEETNRLIRAFSQLPMIPNPGDEERAMGLNRSMWVMRRMGYTQQENPHNGPLNNICSCTCVVRRWATDNLA